MTVVGYRYRSGGEKETKAAADLGRPERAEVAEDRVAAKCQVVAVQASRFVSDEIASVVYYPLAD
jgi:hypothetical protein